MQDGWNLVEYFVHYMDRSLLYRYATKSVRRGISNPVSFAEFLYLQTNCYPVFSLVVWARTLSPIDSTKFRLARQGRWFRRAFRHSNARPKCAFRTTITAHKALDGTPSLYLRVTDRFSVCKGQTGLF